MFTRRIATLTLLLLAPVAITAADPAWLASAGLDVWNVPALQAEIADETERNQSLTADDDDIRQRIDVKEILVTNLIAGRTSLAAVTAQFLALNQSRPGYMDVLRATYPGGTDVETTALAVLGYVAPRLAAQPLAGRFEVMARLEVEFDRLGETQSAAIE